MWHCVDSSLWPGLTTGCKADRTAAASEAPATCLKRMNQYKGQGIVRAYEVPTVSFPASLKRVWTQYFDGRIETSAVVLDGLALLGGMKAYASYLEGGADTHYVRRATHNCYSADCSTLPIASIGTTRDRREWLRNKTRVGGWRLALNCRR